MSTLKYQGEEIEVERTNVQHGAITTALSNIDGEEDLYRDQHGQYYLRRVAWTLDLDGENERPGSGRELVHRLSLRGAILWATTRAWSRTLDLHNDTLDLFRSTGQTSGLLSQSGENVTVPLTLPLDLYRRVLAMAAYDGRTFSESVANSMDGDVEMWLESDSLAKELGKPNPAHFLAEYERELDAGKHPDVYPLAPALVAIAEVATSGKVTEASYPDDPHRFTFTSEPTAKRCGERVEITLSDEQLQRAKGMAEAFGMELDKFLAGVVFRRLPGQPGNREHETGLLADQMTPEHIAFACFDDALTARIERAAQAREMTVDAMIVEAVAGSVDSYEEDMIVHPETGALLHNDRRSVFERVSEAMTAPPIGREQEPQWQREMTRKLVQFSAWLLPKDLQWVEYPGKAYDGEVHHPIATFPLDADCLPVLTIDRKGVALNEPLPVSDPGDVRVVSLDDKVAGLIRRYLEVTPWDFSTADIVNGAVRQGLGQAFKTLDEELDGTPPEGDGFYDGGWGYVEEDVYNAYQRRHGKPETIGADLVPTVVQLERIIHQAADRPDAALAAAPEPELIAPDPDDDEDKDKEQTTPEAADQPKGGA